MCLHSSNLYGQNFFFFLNNITFFFAIYRFLNNSNPLKTIEEFILFLKLTILPIVHFFLSFTLCHTKIYSSISPSRPETKPSDFFRSFRDWVCIKPLVHRRFLDRYFKVLWEEVKLNLKIFSFIGASATKKVCKVKNVQVWIASRYFE